MPAKRAVLLALAILSLNGCFLDAFRYHRPPNPRNPFPLRKVAVAAVLNRSAEQRDAVADGEAVASELTHFPGFDVIWPREWDSSRADLQELLDAASAAGAEAVLLVAVTESNSYPPPRLGLAMAVYPTRPMAQAFSVPYESLMEAGRPMAAALPRPKEGWLGATGRVYDARENAIQDRLHAWGRLRAQSDAVFDWKRGMYSRDEFLRFCASECLRRLCDDAKRQMEREREISSKKVETPSPNPILAPELRP